MITLTEAVISVAGIGGAVVADNVFGLLIDSPKVPTAAKGGQFFLTAICWTACAVLILLITRTHQWQQKMPSRA